MGAGNLALMSMILLQALLGELHRLWAGDRRGGVVRHDSPARTGSRLAFYMPMEVFVGVGLAVAAISVLSSLLEHAAGDGGRTGRGVSR